MSFKCLDISEVEDQKWDRILSQSSHASFYMILDYLKLMHPKWLVFVSNKDDSYEFALAIPVKLFGFWRYGVQPPMLQRLSLLSINEANSDEFMQFVTDILRKKLLYFRLNFDHHSFKVISKFIKIEAQTQVNLICERNNEIENGYSVNHKRNIQKAKKRGIAFLIDKHTSVVLDGFLREKMKGLESSRRKYEHVGNMISFFTTKGQLTAVHALDAQGNRIAACLMFVFRNRAILILSYSDEIGKKMGAMHGIIDHWLHKAGEEYSVLDFEGGRIENLNRFYSGFGAKEEIYFSTQFFRFDLVRILSRM